MDAVELATQRSDAAGRRIHGQGTPESAWARWSGLDRLVRIDLAGLVLAARRIVVVAPHPDDEVLGCGGTLQMLARAGHDLHVIGVTDGDASHPGSRRWPVSRLAAARRDERAAGLARLGVPASPTALGWPDGGVAASEDRLADAIRSCLSPGDLVVTTWRFDGHPDHEATARATVRAAADVGAVCREMPVWMWHWAEPGDPRVPWHRLRRLDLAPSALQAKRNAIAAHASQLDPVPDEDRAPILPGWALARLLRPFETFLDPELAA